MTQPSRSLPPDTVAFQPSFLSDTRARAGSVGWRRKTFALALHVACLALFGASVVWPVASPIARGELAREFKPVLEAWEGWMALVEDRGRTP